MAAVPRRAGKPVEALFLPAADHHFPAEGDHLALLTALEPFLATQMK